MSNENTEERESNSRVINDIEVKIKPKSFEGNKEKNASVDYVHKILDKLVKDLNDTFVPKLNDVLKDNEERVDLWADDIDRVEGLVTDDREDIKILKENFNNLKEEVENLKPVTIDDDNTEEWEAPANSDIL